MKLSNKFTLWFIGIVLLVTPISMGISYYNIKRNIDRAQSRQLRHVNDRIAGQLRKGVEPDRFVQGRPVEVTPIEADQWEDGPRITRIPVYDDSLQRNECLLNVSSFYHINQADYRISSYDYVIRSEEILSGMLHALFWKVLLIIAGVIITTKLVSRYVLSPFRETMKIMYGFNLRKRQKIRLPHTSTHEFRELNGFLQKMTDKATEDYTVLKEFSENASHELQTPLAVIRSKLDLLTETDIRENQAVFIADIQDAVEKLSRINRSLVLLTKLENQEYTAFEDLSFGKVVEDVLSVYEDRIEIKSLSVHKKIDENILVRLHPALGDMLMNNLIGNAIRHNIQNGKIEVILTGKRLVVKNTGRPPEIPTEELFLRFKKGNQCNDSLGLGLAIVKQICDMNGFTVSYRYLEGQHVVAIAFPRSG
ncbi:HAMP domain-containing sensor histidine kinase [Compostibacter hankyongensis]|uniref:histidine kinase n=1 Tax=Compostibacter hankyongensis TaxID=1007089 RepID=A0ABP8FH18_9BACT